MYLTSEQADDRATMTPILGQISGTQHVSNYQKLTSANAFVYQVGDEYIKFPTALRAEKALRREIGISNFLSKRVSFSVPYFEDGKISAVVNGQEGNLFFAKSKKIRGVPLYQATMRAISHNTFTTSLVSVLDELHSIPMSELSSLNIPTFKSRIGKLMDTVLCSGMEQKEVKARVFKQLRSQFGEKESDVLCHRDLHGANIFVSPISGIVTGLLDFGMAELAPPAIEIADMGVYANVGVVSQVSEFYRMKTGRSLGNLYLYHAGDRNRWLQKLIVSCAKQLNVPVKMTDKKQRCGVGEEHIRQ